MNGFTGEQLLPYVLDTLDSVPQLAEYLDATVRSEIPGLGIAHNFTGSRDHLATHNRHRELVLLAAEYLGSGVDFEFERSFGRPVQESAQPNSSLHIDDFAHCAPQPGEDYHTQKLRLHTADMYRGARVTLANFTPVAGIHHPDVVSLDERYNFLQNPGSSVLFRSAATIGSLTCHGFVSIVPRKRRDFYRSDLNVYAHNF